MEEEAGDTEPSPLVPEPEPPVGELTVPDFSSPEPPAVSPVLEATAGPVEFPDGMLRPVVRPADLLVVFVVAEGMLGPLGVTGVTGVTGATGELGELEELGGPVGVDGLGGVRVVGEVPAPAPVPVVVGGGTMEKVWAATIPTIEASASSFARIFEERMLILFRLFYPFVGNVSNLN